MEGYFSPLTNQYEMRHRGAPMPWDEGPPSFEDFLPWSEADKAAMALVEEKLPNWRSAFLMPASEVGVRRRFRLLVRAAGGEEGGLLALRRNVGILCIREEIVEAARTALVRGLGADEAAVVVRQNPGVLAIKASSLEGDALARTVFVAKIIDFLTTTGAPLVTGVQLFFAVSVAKALFDVVTLPNGLSRALPLAQ